MIILYVLRLKHLTFKQTNELIIWDKLILSDCEGMQDFTRFVGFSIGNRNQTWFPLQQVIYEVGRRSESQKYQIGKMMWWKEYCMGYAVLYS